METPPQFSIKPCTEVNPELGARVSSVMQFVAPAQIFLVLWLMAATAPAATALMNGSLVALIDVRSKDLQILPPTDDSSDESVEGDTFSIIDAARSVDVTALIFLALTEGNRTLPFFRNESSVFFKDGERPIALSHSLLHTAVQRHRPKVA